MHILVLGDTHIDDNPGVSSIPPQVAQLLQRASVVVHTGDFTSPAVYREYSEQCSCLRAVRGNHDPEQLQDLLPAVQRFSVAGQRIVVTHGDQWGRPRPSRIWREFQGEADMVIYGHLHLPFVVPFSDGYVLNPGSITQPRSSHPSCMLVSWLEGENQWDIETIWLD